MAINEEDIWRIIETYFRTGENAVSQDEIKSLVIGLINQNLEFSRRFEDLEPFTKLSDNTLIEVRKQAQRIASEIEKEANARASAIIQDAECKAKMETDIMKAEAEKRTEDAIQEKIKAATLDALAIIQLAIEGAEAEAHKTIDDAEKEVEPLQSEVRETVETNKPAVAQGGKESVAQWVESGDNHYEEQWRGKGVVRYYWDVEIQGQQHRIGIFLKTALGVFVRRGQLLVDGEVVRDWGWHPLTIIPQGELEFGVADRRAAVRSRGVATFNPVLMLGSKEIPPVSSKV